MIIQQENRLPYQFDGIGEVKGFKFERINFSDNAFMYKVSPPEAKCHYEVFNRKLTPVCLNFETRTYSDELFKEVYPKAKDFGKWAWCFNDSEKAHKKFKELTEKQ